MVSLRITKIQNNTRRTMQNNTTRRTIGCKKKVNLMKTGESKRYIPKDISRAVKTVFFIE